MKSIKEFEKNQIDLKSSTEIIGGATGCFETEYNVTIAGLEPGHQGDDSITYYDDDGNETGWELKDIYI